MKKDNNLPIAAATALILFAPMFCAAADLVQIYGDLNVSMDRAESNAPASVPSSRASQVPASSFRGTVDKMSRETSNGSHVGFRGIEELGGDFRAHFQIEIPVGADVGSSGNLRNSSAGLAGTWGDVFAGIWDTPYKVVTLQFGAFGAPTAADGNLIGNPGFNVGSTVTGISPSGTSTDAAFDRRQANSLQYWTPTVAGISGRIAYAFGEAASPTAAGGIWSGSLTYAQGPLLLAYAYENHADYFGLAVMGGSGISGTNAHSNDDGHKLIATYNFGTTTIKGVFERLKYRTSEQLAGRVAQYSRNAFYTTLEQRFGVGKLWLGYAHAGDGSCQAVGGTACVAEGLGATQVGVGYWYELSKRTALYTFYDQVRNRSSGSYGIAVPVVRKEPGSNSHVATLGINHRF